MYETLLAFDCRTLRRAPLALTAAAQDAHVTPA